MPAQTGALQLVPPMAMALPLTMRKAPVLGSAAAQTSGTSRSAPVGTPVATCHAGRLNRMLRPPPPAAQPVSDEMVPSAARSSLVPPTAMTAGSVLSYSACSGPVGLCPVSSGLDPASPVDTKMFTPAAASLRKRRCWAATSPSGPPMYCSPRPRLIDSCRRPGLAGRSAMIRSSALSNAEN